MLLQRLIALTENIDWRATIFTAMFGTPAHTVSNDTAYTRSHQSQPHIECPQTPIGCGYLGIGRARHLIKSGLKAAGESSAKAPVVGYLDTGYPDKKRLTHSPLCVILIVYGGFLWMVYAINYLPAKSAGL